MAADGTVNNAQASLGARQGSHAEAVVDVHELLHAILFQHHHSGQAGAAQTGAVLTVHHVRLPAAVLTRHKQQVKHLQVALVAIVGRLVLHTALVGDLFAKGDQLVS